jgi:kinesin family protein 18/19
MLGTEQHPGIMFLTLQELFEKVNTVNANNKVVTVTLSYIEVYNEQIRDLLNPTTDFLELREDLKGIKVVGVTELQATNVNQVMNLLRRGNRNRSQEPTTMNEESSRSHAVLQVVVEQKDKTPDTREIIKIGKLSLIDLAGSERASVSNNRGQRLLEGANINRSLLALGNCINALGEKGNKGAYVPYRDSKLTRLLKDSLGGNCRTVMIANIGPAHICVEDTTNTLKYANRAKNIKTTFTRNVLNVDHHIAQYTKIISALRSEISELTEKLDVVTKQERVNAKLDADNAHNNVDFGRIRKEVNSNFDDRTQIRRQLVELEQLEAQNRIDVNKIQVEISQSTSVPHNDDEVSSPTPRSVKQARKELTTLMQNMRKNTKLKASLESQLAEHEERGRTLRQELQLLANTKEKKFIVELLYRIHVLELENMELSATSQSATTTVDEKDLQIQKLRLQLQVRDKIITSQRTLLNKNGITYDEPHNVLNFNSSIPHKALEIVASDIVSPRPSDQNGKTMWKQVNKFQVTPTHNASFVPNGSFSSAPQTPTPGQSHNHPSSSPAGRKGHKQSNSIDQEAFANNMAMAKKLQAFQNKQKESDEEEEEEDALDILSKPSIQLPVIKSTYASKVQNGGGSHQVPARPQQKFPALALLKGRNKPTIEVPNKGSESDDEDDLNRVVSKNNNNQNIIPRAKQAPQIKPAQPPQKIVNNPLSMYKNNLQHVKKMQKKVDNKKKPVGPARPLQKANTDDLIEHQLIKKKSSVQSL